MKKLGIIIRVDGDNKIGMGHVYRSLNLGIELKSRGHKIIFLTKNLVVKKILSKNFECKLLPKNPKAEQKLLLKLNADITIIDKLKEKASNIKIFKRNCRNVIALDYTGDNKDILPFGINILYQKSGISNKKSVSGFEYAILNKVFKRTKPIHVKKKITSLLIVQGGSDTRCFIPKIIEILNNLKEELKVISSI